MYARFFAPLLGLMAAALLFSVNTAAAFDEGIDYKTLSRPQPTESGDKIEVVELFWYGCGHCFHLEPEVQEWLKSKPDYVEFRRVPAVMGRGWVTGGRAYFALEMLGEADRLHEPFFNAIHVEKLRLFDEKSIADWVATQGVDRDKFLAAYRSFVVDMKVRQAAKYGQQVGLEGVPDFVVNGKYTTSPGLTGNRNKAFEVINYLAALEAGKIQPQEQEQPTAAAEKKTENSKEAAPAGVSAPSSEQ